MDIIELSDSRTVFETSEITSKLPNQKFGDASENKPATETSLRETVLETETAVETETNSDLLETDLGRENNCIGKDDLDSRESVRPDSCEVDSADKINVQEIKINGRRIVDLTIILEQLRKQCTKHNSSNECSFVSLKLRKYVDRGLRHNCFSNVTSVIMLAVFGLTAIILA